MIRDEIVLSVILPVTLQYPTLDVSLFRTRRSLVRGIDPPMPNLSSPHCLVMTNGNMSRGFKFHQPKEVNAYPYTTLAEGTPDEQRRHRTQSPGMQTLTWSSKRGIN